MDTQELKVLSVNERYFISHDICDASHVGDESIYTIKDDMVYNKVTPEEIGIVCADRKIPFVIEKANLKVYIVVPEEEPDHLFDVCCYDNRYFVDREILQKFHISPLNGKARVDGNYYYEISPQQIAIIEGSSIYGVWKANYRKIVSNQ